MKDLKELRRKRKKDYKLRRLKKETMEEKYINKIKEIEKYYEKHPFYEGYDVHKDFDDCILDFLEELGYKDIVNYYRYAEMKYGFWTIDYID